MSRTFTCVIKFILAYLCTITVGLVTGWGITRIDLLMPLLCLVFYILFDAVHEKVICKNGDWSIAHALVLDGLKTADIRGELRFSLPLALLFSLSVVAGRHLDVWEDIITPWKISDILLLIVYALLFTALLIVLFRVTDRNIAGTSAHRETVGYKQILIRACILIVCYLPYYLTLFPGNLGKDTFESVDMVLGNIPWTNHHPIFFTMLIDAVFALTGRMGSYSASLGVFTFLHMAAVALTLGYISCHMRRWNKAALVFFAIHPFFPMYSIYITKDVLFSCALAVLVLRISGLKISRSEDATDEGISSNKVNVRDFLGIGVISLLVMLLRNNGLMIIAILVIVLFFCDKKGLRSLVRVAPLMAAIVIFLLFKTVSYSVLDIAPESFAESASIPLEQVGYVIDTHTDEELNNSLGSADSEILSSIMPYERVREEFDLGYTDTLKFDESFDDAYFNEHKGDFLRIWAKLLPGYFGEYVEAYLAQTAGYWNYGQTNSVSTFGVWELNEIGVERIDVLERMTGASLYGIIDKLILGMRKAPLLCILSSMAMEFYAVLLAIVMLRRRGVRSEDNEDKGQNNKAVALSFTPLILLWITIMIATPAFCLFRYMFAFFILWPYTLYVILHGGVTDHNDEA